MFLVSSELLQKVKLSSVGNEGNIKQPRILSSVSGLLWLRLSSLGCFLTYALGKRPTAILKCVSCKEHDGHDCV